jgi:hypothetical protein
LSADARAKLAAVARGIAAPSDPEAGHISFEQIQAFVDGNTFPADAAEVESHVLDCGICRAEVDDLREFAAGLREGRSRAARFRWYVAAGAIAAVLVIGAFLVSTHPPRAGKPELAISIRDGAYVVGLDRQETLSAPPEIPPPDRQLLIGMLRDRVLPVSVNDNLRSNRSVLLGAGGEESPFRLLSPVGETVRSPKPEFRWQPLPGSDSYKVEVFDSSFNLVLSSPAIAATSWVPGVGLPRQKLFLWQVTANRAGSTLKAPQPPDPEARFQILDERAAASIEEAQEMTPPSRLLLAIRFANAGLCRDALAEIAGLNRTNPGSAVLPQLQASVAAQCPSSDK